MNSIFSVIDNTLCRGLSEVGFINTCPSTAELAKIRNLTKPFSYSLNVKITLYYLSVLDAQIKPEVAILQFDFFLRLRSV